MTGVVLGAYATYIKGGLFADASFKADLLNLNLAMPSISGMNNSTSANSYGGMLDTGYRLHIKGLVHGVDVEPLATLAAVRTEIGGMKGAGSTISFGDNDSIRLAAGARLSGDLVRNSNYLLRFNVTTRVWNEFESKNHTTFSEPGSPDLTLRDKFSGAFEEVSGGLQVFGQNGQGWSGFVDGDWKVKHNYSSPGVTVGFRYQW
jgi:outer membrane autotransporter protein